MVRQDWVIGCLLGALCLGGSPGVAESQDDDTGCIAGCGQPKTPPASCEAGCIEALPEIKLKATTLDEDAHEATLIGASVETETETAPKPVEAMPAAGAPRLPKGHPKGAHDGASGVFLHGNLSPLRY